MGNEPVVIVDSGASYIDQEDREWMLREQIHAQQCEITALRKALMYKNPVKELTDEEIMTISTTFENRFVDTEFQWSACILDFARAILRKAQE